MSDSIASRVYEAPHRFDPAVGKEERVENSASYAALRNILRRMNEKKNRKREG